MRCEVAVGMCLMVGSVLLWRSLDPQFNFRWLSIRMCNCKFFQTLSLMMVLKHFNLLPIHHPPEVEVGKGYNDMGEVDLFRNVLWSSFHLRCQEISSSVYRSPVTTQSTLKSFTDIPAVQFSSIGKQRWWHDPAG